MNYVEHLNFFGVEAKENPCIKGNGAPTEQTVGLVGMFYMDTDTGAVYKCVAVENGVHTWAEMGGRSEAMSRWTGKNVLVFGDSISTDNYPVGEHAYPKWATMLKEKNGFNLFNYSVHGYGYLCGQGNTGIYTPSINKFNPETATQEWYTVVDGHLVFSENTAYLISDVIPCNFGDKIYVRFLRDGTMVTMSFHGFLVGEDGETKYVTAGGYNSWTTPTTQNGITNLAGCRIAIKYADVSYITFDKRDKIMVTVNEEPTEFMLFNPPSPAPYNMVNQIETAKNDLEAQGVSPDLVVLFMGTNDFGNAVPIGARSDGMYTTTYMNETYLTPKHTQKANVNTFYGAVEHCMARITELWPGAAVAVLTPLQREFQWSATAGMSLVDYKEIIKSTAEMFSFPVLDLFVCGGLCPTNKYMRERWTYEFPSDSPYAGQHDGLHPTEEFIRTRLAPAIDSFLESL